MLYPSPKTLAITIGLIGFGVLEQVMPFFEPSRKPMRNLTINFGLGLFNALAMSSGVLFLLNLGWSYRAAHPDLLGFSLCSTPVALVFSFLILDAYLYLWHRAMHRWGWKIHRLHHTDRFPNLSTSYRFHPIEVLLSQLTRTGLIFLLGIMPQHLLVYEVVFSLSLLFHHSNWHLPLHIDRLLSHFIVTPNLHRLHHSQEVDRSPANFSSLLTIWDQIGGTFRYPKRPQRLHAGTRT